MEYLVLLPLALAAGTIGGVIGTGSSLMLMPAFHRRLIDALMLASGIALLSGAAR